MKKNHFALLIIPILVILFACDQLQGPEGPTGPEGPSGEYLDSDMAIVEGVAYYVKSEIRYPAPFCMIQAGISSAITDSNGQFTLLISMNGRSSKNITINATDGSKKSNYISMYVYGGEKSALLLEVPEDFIMTSYNSNNIVNVSGWVYSQIGTARRSVPHVRAIAGPSGSGYSIPAKYHTMTDENGSFEMAILLDEDEMLYYFWVDDGDRKSSSVSLTLTAGTQKSIMLEVSSYFIHEEYVAVEDSLDVLGRIVFLNSLVEGTVSFSPYTYRYIKINLHMTHTDSHGSYYIDKDYFTWTDVNGNFKFTFPRTYSDKSSSSNYYHTFATRDYIKNIKLYLDEQEKWLTIPIESSNDIGFPVYRIDPFNGVLINNP